MPNWVDLVIIIIFLIYVWDGYHRGFLRLTWELAGLLVAFAFALRFYPGLNVLIKNFFGLPDAYSKPLCFLFIWVMTQLVFYIAGSYISFYTPHVLKESKINNYFGLIPAALKGIIFISVLLILFVIMPTTGSFKNTISKSMIGGYLIGQTANIEGQIETVFSGGNSTLGSLTTINEDENAKLNFSTTDISIDQISEKQMLSMVNLEREKVGSNPLIADDLLRNVARAKSRDMLLKGYFAHTSPTGEALSDRLNNSHVSFVSAGENLALAPTINLAEIGLMNSPKHKANMLDPQFTRVGIGVLDAGQYGIMVTQEFAN